MKVNPFAVFREEFDGTALLFNPGNNKILNLNSSAVVIWKCLTRNMDDREIIEALQEKFDGAAPGELESDLRSFKSKLAEYDLLTE